MARADIKITLDREAVALISTRIINCGAYDCKNNLINYEGEDRMACNLREIDVGPRGECREYDPVGEKENG